MVYVLLVRKRGYSKDEITEVVAPDLFTATVLLASENPGIEIVEYQSSYPEGQKGRATLCW
jgi:hypothetical protein